MSQQLPGRVITFYSFKGGTGRSMALANIATTIAQRNGNRVLAIDWDLEAPGLHRYFRPYLKLTGTIYRDEEMPGLIELLNGVMAGVRSQSAKLSREELVASVFGPANLNEFLLPTDLPTLSLLKAGSFDSSYSSRINSFDWTGLFERQPEFFGAFADYLASRFTHVLIDSRTGYTDISGICTSLLPDSLVAVFTPNLQSLDGALEMVRRAVTYRVESDDLRPLRTFPLVSRVELSELKLNDSWRFGDALQDIPGYQPRFERLFEQLYGVESCDLTAYFDQAQVAYVPYYAFGEKIAARSEDSGTVRLSRNFSEMTDILLSASSAWESRPANPDSETRSEIPWDTDWFESKLNPPDSWAIQARASLSRVRPSVQRHQLFILLRGSPAAAAMLDEQVPASGDTINVIGETRRGKYAYWVVRTNGDCRLIWPLPSGPGSLEVSATELVESVAETLLNLRWLYGSLGVTLRADLRVDIRFPAEIGTFLRVPAPNGVVRRTRTSPEDVSHIEEVVLGRIDNDLVALTRRFAAPMLEAFEGSCLDDETYQRIIGEVQASASLG